MTLGGIVEKFSELTIDERRAVESDYVELVFKTGDTEQWSKILAEVLGPPAKPAGADPSKEDQRLTKDYGGIFPNQTLFKKDFEDYTLIAMFWPWQDGVSTTLKMARI